MPYAHSTNIDKLLEAIDQHLGRVQHAFIALIALVFAADDTSFHDPALFSPESGAQAEGRERLFSLIRMARDKGEEVARALDAAQTALVDRAAYYGKVMAEDSPNARVAEGLDEAVFVLESAGARTIVLLFDAEEMERLGEKPLARLVALQERAVERLKTRTIEEAGEAYQAMSEALALAKLLAEGAESRDWTDDDQEGGSGAGEAGEVGSEGAAGEGDQEGEGEAGQSEADRDGTAGATGEGTAGGEV
ncbi:MAG TPA: hypothetical protein VH877_18670 [Polyangia bacterium]|jgi:hypothetical protein|nr:hypothetical protein [Polyangia bacterium]